MNIKRFIPAILLGFAFVFGFEFVVHGHLMKDMYDATAHLWRPEAEMQDFMPYMMAAQFLFVVAMGWVFTRNYEAAGIGEGVRFGLSIGILLAVVMGSFYCFMPIPVEMAAYWAVAAIIESIGVGICFALIYKDV